LKEEMTETRKLFSNSLIVIVGTLVASIFSYLFNMLMGRYLGPANYGEMTALMSLLMIISVAGGALLTVAMRYSSELFVGGKFLALKKLFAVLTRYVYFFSFVLIIILLALIKPIANYFSIDNLLPVAIAFSGLIFGMVTMVNKGLLQGVQKFSAVSLIGVLEMALRLGLGILLVKIGFAVSGALSAVILATAIGYAATFFPIRKIFKNSHQDKVSKFHLFDKKEIGKYFGPAFLSSLLLIIALNLDVILVKHYFSPADAGMYSAVSAIGKIILYVTAPIISVMFPMISEKTVSGEKHYKLLFFSLMFVIVGALIVLAAYVIAPAKIIGLLYGSQYVSLFYLLPEIGLAILLYSLINLLTNYYLVVKDFRFLWFFLIAVAGLTLAISQFHSSLLLVVRLMILFFGLLFLSMMVYYLLSKRDQIKSTLRG